MHHMNPGPQLSVTSALFDNMNMTKNDFILVTVERPHMTYELALINIFVM